MISLIYGPKGSGKTKRIIDSANDAVSSAKGTIVYITNKQKHSKELNYNIRFVDTVEYDVRGEADVLGFIKGILASNNDIERVYIDGLARIAGIEVAAMQPLYKSLEKLSGSDNAEFILTVSCDELPEFFKNAK